LRKNKGTSAKTGFAKVAVHRSLPADGG